MLAFLYFARLRYRGREADVKRFIGRTLHFLHFDFVTHKNSLVYCVVYYIVYTLYIITCKKGFCNEKKQILELLEKSDLNQKTINQMAVGTRLIERDRSIKAVDLLAYFISESFRGCLSCNDLAAKINAETGILASRQAYHKKLNANCLEFFERVLAGVMQAKLKPAQAPDCARKFERVLVQDSTVIKLPTKLMPIFSGVKNAHTKVCNARIQNAYDLRTGDVVKFSIDAYSKNDLSAAAELKLKSGDLVLRDRGYFVVSEFRRIIDAKADFISRYKHKQTLHHPTTGAAVNLIDLLKKYGNLDMEVLVGKEKQTRLRLIAVKVDEKTANSRRRKAKKQVRGHNPGKEVLFLMGWSIYITSLTGCELSIEQLVQLYRLRWRIETIFKTWKSNFCFDHIHNVGENQLKIILTARMIAVTLFYQAIYIPLIKPVREFCKRELSLIKLMRYIQRNLTAIPLLIAASRLCVSSLKIVAKYCTYDTRKRQNYNQLEHEILNPQPLS